jgi:D-ribose pyranose/furanose isomerase RbsD
MKKTFLIRQTHIVRSPNIGQAKALIFDEQRRLQWKMNATDETPEYIEACETIENNLVYKDIDISERIHEIHLEYNTELIEKLQDRITLSRIWLQEFHIKQLEKKAKNRFKI